MLEFTFTILLRRVNLSSEKLGHERRKWKVISTSFLNCKVILKTVWICICEGRNFVSNFTPAVLWQSNIVFPVGLLNFKIFDMKMLGASEFWMLESTLFDSIMVDWKYEFLKNWCFTLISGIFCAFLILYWQFDYGIISKSKRYFRQWFLYILKKRHSFLYQCFRWRDSKPSSWYFSLDVLLWHLW